MAYTMDLNKFYKIWFSKNYNEFMGQENQLRLVRLRDRHPDREISLIYSARCLSIAAQQQLHFFCQTHRIKAIDFDTTLKSAIKSDQERKLHVIATVEIEKAIHNEGGNLAAASDIVRLLSPAIKLGIYSDLDAELDFRSLPERSIQANAPMLLAIKAEIIEEIEEGTKNYSIDLNNEIIFVANNTSGDICKKAQNKLIQFKQEIISHYCDFNSVLRKIAESSPYRSFLLSFDTPNLDLFKFRHFIQELTIFQFFERLPVKKCEYILKTPYLKDQWTEIDLYTALGKSVRQDLDNSSSFTDLELGQKYLIQLKHQIHLLTVIETAGSSVFDILWDPKNYDEDNARLINQYSVYHSGLTPYIRSQLNRPDNQISFPNDIGHFCDLSWTPLGAEKVAQRQEKMVDAANVIKHAWKNYRERSKSSTVSSPRVKKAKYN